VTTTWFSSNHHFLHLSAHINSHYVRHQSTNLKSLLSKKNFSFPYNVFYLTLNNEIAIFYKIYIIFVRKEIFVTISKLIFLQNFFWRSICYVDTKWFFLKYRDKYFYVKKCIFYIKLRNNKQFFKRIFFLI